VTKFRCLFIKFPYKKPLWVTGATCSATGLFQRLGRLHERNARLEEDGSIEFDRQCKLAAVLSEQVSVCVQEAETEQASVRVQETETDCPPKISSDLNDLPT